MPRIFVTGSSDGLGLMSAEILANQGHDVTLHARNEAFSNAVHPGWVATKMGGRGAPDDLQLGGMTQAWLAVSDDPKAKVSGQYFFHQKIEQPHPDSHDAKIQDAVLAYCEKLSGVALPKSAKA